MSARRMREAAARLSLQALKDDGLALTGQKVAEKILSLPLPSPTDEDVKRVARAIAWAACEDLPTDDDRRIARAAIQAYEEGGE